ncbi:hypothetical protein N752_00265 [Desulforamulus aquiferis]|nr:hypothetical protein N752_00265 [Desulforamulus aquiferis]
MRLVVNGVQRITVRDELSCRDLQDMKITRPEIRVTADPVLGLEQRFVDDEAGRKILEQAGVNLSKEKKLIGVSPREWQGLSEYKQVLAALCDKLSRVGFQVVFLPMHYPDDLKTSQEIVSLMEQPATVLTGNYSVADTAALIANMDLLVGMRLHALILAAVMGVPPVAISYDPKIDRFMNLLGREAAINVAEPDFDCLWEDVQTIICDPWVAREELVQEVEPLRQRARESAVMALQVLDSTCVVIERRLPIFNALWRETMKKKSWLPILCLCLSLLWSLPAWAANQVAPGVRQCPFKRPTGKVSLSRSCPGGRSKAAIYRDTSHYGQ